jgi:hypothetical protein
MVTVSWMYPDPPLSLLAVHERSTALPTTTSLRSRSAAYAGHAPARNTLSASATAPDLLIQTPR